MELAEDEPIEHYGKQCGHCSRKTLLPYEYEFTCIASGYNLIKRKHELSKIQRKEINFINRLKHAEHKIFCICFYVYKIYEGNDFDNFSEVLSTLKNKKRKIIAILTERYKDLIENRDFEQNHHSRTARVDYEIGHDSIRLMKWLA